MTRIPNALATEETLKNLIRRSIAYGIDERARYVEHVCSILLDSRLGPGSSDDMFTLEEHLAENALPMRIDLSEPGATATGSRQSVFKSLRLRDVSALGLTTPSVGAVAGHHGSDILGRAAARHHPP